MAFLDYLTLSQEYIYNGTLEEFETHLSKVKSVRVKKIARRKFRLIPFVTIGVYKGESVSVVATVSELSSHRQHIKFTTDVRSEVFLMALAFPLVTVGILLSDEPWWIIFPVWGLLILVHFWFHWVFRAQEEGVMLNTARTLRLVKAN